MRYEWFIAKRYLRPQGGATFIFHLTIISMTGVALGVAALVTVLSVMNGFGNDIREKILLGQSHVIQTYWDGLENWQKFIPHFQEVENVEACSPIIKSWGALYSTDYRGQGRYAVTFVGIDPALEPNVTGLKEKLIAGDLQGLEEEMKPASTDKKVKITDVPKPKPAGIIIGKELAKSLFAIGGTDHLSDEEKKKVYEAVIGQSVTLIAVPDQAESLSMGATNDKIFTIEGVFESGFYQYDYGMVYISIPSAQYLLELPHRITQIQFRLGDYSESATRSTQKEIRELNSKLTGFGVTETWMQFNQVYFEALAIEKTTMRYILMIIIFVATFNIIATLFMVVTEKTRDIGLLRAIGAGRGNVMCIFIILGLIVGILGTGAGVSIGFFLCKIIQWYKIQIPGGGEVYYLKYLPCDMQLLDFIGVSIYTTIISFLASLYPSIRASKLVPVDALRFS
ncbi:FtsX-like permease family protein [bacterium]|nr:FtsX-like permease family protein [bacterium]